MAGTYVRAVSPQLRKVLLVVWALVMVLGANSAYLASITFAEWVTGRTYQNYFYLWMFIGHLARGPSARRSLCAVRRLSRSRGVASAESARREGRLRSPGERDRSARLRAAPDALSGIHADAARCAHGCLLGPRSHAGCGGVALRPASLGGAAHQMASGTRVGGRRRCAHRHRYRDAPAESSTVECRRAQGRRSLLHAVVRTNDDRPVHSGADADDGRLLQDVSCGHARAVVQERASIQLVQQSVLSRERA